MKKFDSKDYFDEMVEKLAINEITVKQYSDYFQQIKTALANNELKHPLVYINSLMCAFVSPVKSYYEEEIFIAISSELDDLITKFAQEETSRIDLNDYYDKIKNILNSQTISCRSFSDYCQLLTLAHMAKITTVDLVEWTRLLLEAKVTTNTYDENRKVYFEKKRLRTFLQRSFETGQCTDKIKK